MDKSPALLNYLKAVATLRRKRVASYESGDKLVWFADVPRDRTECRSPFLAETAGEFVDFWLEVKKKRMPKRPALPDQIEEWVRPEDLEQGDKEPDLCPEITVLIEVSVPDPEAHSGNPRNIIEKRPQVRNLSEYPEVVEGFLDYLANKWEPWVKEYRRWLEVQRVYENLDFMRRRIEESEERYEFILAVGLLQWRDPTGTSVKRHVFTAPAEITLDASRGILSVVPAASFDHFRVELDMLELQHQPRIKLEGIENQLEEIDIQVWDSMRFGKILAGFANLFHSDTQVDEMEYKPSDRTEDIPRLSFAPALVLRERRPIAYEDLINKFLNSSSVVDIEESMPWRRLLLEGELLDVSSDGRELDPNGNVTASFPLDSYLFPLPANDEQRQIVHRLEHDPCVLVKGPPGTGKSHTIANLICHLLALGDRILVTSHAPKALAVLRDLLPTDIRDLSVTSLGSSQKDQTLLEESVRGILRRKNDFVGAEQAKQIIDQTNEGLQEIHGEIAAVERRLRECREAETHSHSLPGGYQGTAAQIARRLHDEMDQYAWFPEASFSETAFPLQPSEILFLAEVHGELNIEMLEYLKSDVGSLQLPDPEEFTKIVSSFRTTEEYAERIRIAVDIEKSEFLFTTSSKDLELFETGLVALDELAFHSLRVLGSLTEKILADFLVGNADRWIRLACTMDSQIQTVSEMIKKLGTIRVNVPSEIQIDHLRSDAERRRVHFEQGGHRGYGVFAPRLVKETRYVEEQCLVDGQKPKDASSLARVIDFLQLKGAISEFERLWPSPLPDLPGLAEANDRCEELSGSLKRIIDFFKVSDPDSFAVLSLKERNGLAFQNVRIAWLKAIKAESARREAQTVKGIFQEILETIRRCQSVKDSHPCLEALVKAAKSYEIAAWRIAWDERERVRSKKQRFEHYDKLRMKLDSCYPGLGKLLNDTTGDCNWNCNLHRLEKAWAWWNAHFWLQRVSNASIYKDLMQDYHRLQEKLEKTTEKLVSIKAWSAFFKRLDDPTVQSLNAWMKAMDRIGKVPANMHIAIDDQPVGT